jgi:predicted ATPase/class 3 adenylate cyclase
VSGETLTYWFSDLEGSTRLWEEHPIGMQSALARHDEILNEAVVESGGRVVKSTGDGLMAVFDTPLGAIGAAVAAQDALHTETWTETGPLRVRMGIHLGPSQPRAGDYYGTPVNRAARIMSAAHGGQVLVSDAVASACRDSLPARLGLEDLGMHRLKDLTGSERLHQLLIADLPSAFPPPSTLELRPNNLPTQTSVFLGREDELSSLRTLLHTPDVRLITLVGPGGTGKTRLALEAAVRDLDRYEDGLFFVPLAEARTSDDVFTAIGRELNIDLPPEGSRIDGLRTALANRRVLLLLDNFEQITDGAADVVDLLSSCPHLTALVTSREALRVRGERLFPVAPLSIPARSATLEDVMASEAVRLFVERAVEVQPSFTITEVNAATIAEICTRLDGLPLAIELATARLRIFSPTDLLSRLERRLDLLKGGARDLPGRQQTIRAAIQWSFELLDDHDRMLCLLVSAFAGARIEDVEAVALGIDAFADTDVIDGLQSLVDKSLVRRIDDDSPWFAMLGTVRDYAQEQLATYPDMAAAVRRTHADHYCTMARNLRPLLTGSDRESALLQLTRNIDNLLLAWRHLLEDGSLESLYDFLDPLWALHDAKGWYAGVIDLARDLLGLLGTLPETPELVREKVALQTSVARALMTISGYGAEVEAAFKEALALSDETGQVPERFPVLRSLTSLYTLSGDMRNAAHRSREMLKLALAHDDPAMEMEASMVVGVHEANSGAPEQGLARLERAVELYDPTERRHERFRLGPNPGIQSLTSSALVLAMLGHNDRALLRARRAEEESAALNHPATRAYALHHVAFVYSGLGRFDLIGDLGNELLTVAIDHDYPIWRAVAMVWQGLAVLAAEDAGGLSRLDRPLRSSGR